MSNSNAADVDPRDPKPIGMDHWPSGAYTPIITPPKIEIVGLAAKRAAVRIALDAQAKNVERRAYFLPVALLSRVLDYQLAELLPSEVVAVRALLEIGLKEKGF